MSRSVSPDPDPRETFAEDQAAAQEETMTRDEQAWGIHRREQYDLHVMRQAEAARTAALGRLFGALASAVALAVFVAAVLALSAAIQAIR